MTWIRLDVNVLARKVGTVYKNKKDLKTSEIKIYILKYFIPMLQKNKVYYIK